MKKIVGLTLVLILLVSTIPVFAAKSNKATKGNWWLLGTVTGGSSEDPVVTLRLVRVGDSEKKFVSQTSTNKYGQYAFSNPGSGLPPSAYKLVVFVGHDRVMEVSLEGVKPGGRVSPIHIKW